MLLGLFRERESFSKDSSVKEPLCMHARVFHTHNIKDAQEPYIFAKEPYVFAKEPYVFAKEPYVFMKEPYLFARETYILAKEHIYIHTHVSFTLTM